MGNCHGEPSLFDIDKRKILINSAKARGIQGKIVFTT
jgi:hypothetical protein